MGTISVYVDIDVDDILSDLSDADLAREMESRNLAVDDPVGHAIYLNNWEADELKSSLALGDDAGIRRILNGRAIDPVAPVSPITIRAIQEAADKASDENKQKGKAA